MAGLRTAELGGHEPKAVQKALSLLEAVASLGPGAAARDIAAMSRIPPATAYRLLNLLVADGFLVRVEDLSGFALGRRTRELAGAGAPPEPDTDRGVVLEELRSQVRFGIYLASYADDRVRLVDRDPDHELTGESAITAHLHASAIGKLLLARLPEHARPRPLRRVTAHTITDPSTLAAELRRVRDADAAGEMDECRVGRTAVAVPVRTSDGRVAGCLAAIGKTGRLEPADRDVRDLLRSFASRLCLPAAESRSPAANT
ncbi:IclR family transcriptional regulator [Rhodococcus oryzae]|uniref:IclR family transcriptional regulator n=1 Tax=Rhodococcus oryzae TaxID=2571143 RepID=UPI0037917629